MSILNVDKIQPIGGGSTITVDATDIQVSTGTIRASTFSGDVSATGIGVTSLNVAGVTTFAQKINLSDNFIRNCRGFNTGNEQARIIVKAGDDSAGGGLRIAEYYNDDTTLFSSEIANFYTTGIELKENVSITGDLTIPDKIVHSGDTNTAIRFPAADTISMETAGSTRFGLSSSGNVEIYGSETGNNKALIYNGTGALGFYASSNSGVNRDFRFYSSNSNSNESLRISSNGNVNVYKDLDVDGHTNLDNVSIAGVTTFAQAAGAVTVPAGGDIRIANSGGWTGEYGGKIQQYLNFLYIQGGSNGIRFRYTDGNDRWVIGSSGHFDPGASGTYDIGNTGNRVRQIYTNHLNVGGATTCTGGATFLNSISLNASTNNYIYFNDNLNFTRNGHGNELTIDSSGRLFMNGAVAANAFSGGDDLIIGNTSARSGITLVSSTSNDGGLYFSKGTSSNSDHVKGQIVYQHDNNGGYMRFYTNAGEKVRINSDGYVTESYQPSFAVYRAQQAWSVNDGDKMIFNTNRHNIGNHYNTSNGRFTAPVSGSYQFNFYSILQGNYDSAYIQLKVDGARIKGGDYHFSYDQGNDWNTASYSQVLKLSANEYVEIYSYTGTSSGSVTWHGNNWQCWSGYLLG